MISIANRLLITSFFFLFKINIDIVDIEKPDGICSPTFVVYIFLGLFLYASIVSIKYSKPA